MTRRYERSARARSARVLAAVVGLGSVRSRHRGDPRCHQQAITIGGTFPLTGPAALYSVIPKAEAPISRTSTRTAA